MKTKLSFLLALLFAGNLLFAQSDKIYLHNGKILDVVIEKSEQYTINFKYVNEDAEQIIGKLAIEKLYTAKVEELKKLQKKL